MQAHCLFRTHPRLRGVHIPHAAVLAHALAPAAAVLGVPLVAPLTATMPSPFPVGSLSPAQILRAYGFQQNQFAGVEVGLIGIGSLGGTIVEADLDNMMAAWGMLQPNLTMMYVGGAGPDPSNVTATTENILDVAIAAFTVWYLTGKAAQIVICTGPNRGDGMMLVTRGLVAAGCLDVNWSWGAAESAWASPDRATLAATLADAVAADCTVWAASGDNSVDDGTPSKVVNYPCGDANVVAVGGTNLKLTPDGLINREEAWGDGRPGDEGGGGGYDLTTPMPAWQLGIVPILRSSGNVRGAPDVAANGDPNTGWQISANGSWTVVGGTSAASPFWCALAAVQKAAAGVRVGLISPLLYGGRDTICRDITLGSNGFQAAKGWDCASGNGSPNGAGLYTVLMTSLSTAPAPGLPQDGRSCSDKG